MFHEQEAVTGQQLLTPQRVTQFDEAGRQRRRFQAPPSNIQAPPTEAKHAVNFVERELGNPRDLPDDASVDRRGEVLEDLNALLLDLDILAHRNGRELRCCVEKCRQGCMKRGQIYRRSLTQNQNVAT
jgi:hypothetical protein